MPAFAVVDFRECDAFQPLDMDYECLDLVTSAAAAAADRKNRMVWCRK